MSRRTPLSRIPRLGSWEYLREYRIGIIGRECEWEWMDRFMASDDAAANEYAKRYYARHEWFVLDQNGRDINGDEQK